MPGNPDVILIFLSSRERFIDKLNAPKQFVSGRFCLPGRFRLATADTVRYNGKVLCRSGLAGRGADANTP